MIMEWETLKKKQTQKVANRASRIAAQKAAGRKMNISPLTQ